MQRTSLKDAPCPIARGIERIGDPWTVLILREAFYGATRFDEFQKRLGIAPNMLTRRLNTLVQEGMLRRRQYSEHPPRSEYVLTDLGRDFRPVLLTLLAWGNRHFAPEGEIVQLVERKSGRVVRPILVDEATLQRITVEDHRIAPGPAASEGLRTRLGRPSHPPLSTTEPALSTMGTLDSGDMS